MAASTDTNEPSRAIVAEAAQWQVQLADEGCTADDREEWAAWLDADPVHRIAFERMGVIAERFAGQPAIERAALKRMMGPNSRRTGAVTILMVGMIATLGWWVSDNVALRTRFADERTLIGEQRPLALASGDALTLDSDTAADISDGGRSILLWRGEVMADVKHGQPKPFVVRTGEGTARALGTRYSVRASGDGTIVTVIASRVEACAAHGDRRCATLESGQAARMDVNGLMRLPDVDPFEAEAWAQGTLYADDRPLVSVLAELNRYRSTPIRYDAAALSGLNVSGSFPLTDTERALAAIARALPITIHRGSGEITVSRR